MVNLQIARDSWAQAIKEMRDVSLAGMTLHMWSSTEVEEYIVRARSLLERCAQDLQIISYTGAFLAGGRPPGELVDCPDCAGQGALPLTLGEAFRRDAGIDIRVTCGTCEGTGHL